MVLWGRGGKRGAYTHHLGPNFLWSLQVIIIKPYFICGIFQCKKKYQHFSAVHMQEKEKKIKALY